MKRYYVKHEEWYASRTDRCRWLRERKDPDVFVTASFVKARARAQALRDGPRQFTGLGANARVVSVGVP